MTFFNFWEFLLDTLIILVSEYFVLILCTFKKYTRRKYIKGKERNTFEKSKVKVITKNSHFEPIDEYQVKV